MADNNHRQNAVRDHDDEPLSNTPDNRVTIRSVRSLHGTLPAHAHNGVALPGPGAHYEEEPLTVMQCLKTVLLATRMNILLIFIPLGYMAEKLHWAPVAVFMLNFIAIIPLAKRRLGICNAQSHACGQFSLFCLTFSFITLGYTFVLNVDCARFATNTDYLLVVQKNDSFKSLDMPQRNLQ